MPSIPKYISKFHICIICVVSHLKFGWQFIIQCLKSGSCVIPNRFTTRLKTTIFTNVTRLHTQSILKICQHQSTFIALTDGRRYKTTVSSAREKVSIRLCAQKRKWRDLIGCKTHINNRG